MGPPNTYIVDPASYFRHPFADISDICSVKFHSNGGEANSSLNIGERLHQPLHQTSRKLSINHSMIAAKLLLILAVKALNDTIGSDAVVPSALFF